MVAIRFLVPNQVMIDDFWISIRRDARFTQSYGRYHCGCMVGAPGGSEALEQLAIRLGKMLAVATRVIVALDYPWKEIWDDDVKRKDHTTIASPRSRYGQATLPAEQRVDSGATLRARRPDRVHQEQRLLLLTAVPVESNPARGSPDKMRMGITFDEQMVYMLGSEQRRAKFRRATQRCPTLQGYESGAGDLGAVLTGLKGHMTLSYQIPRVLGDDPEFPTHASSVFMKFLRPQRDNDNPEHLLWINRVPLGEARGHSGVTSRVASTWRRSGATIIT